MKKAIWVAAASLSLLSISATCRADNFYIDNNDPAKNFYVFNSKTGSYSITANADCKGKTGGRICITLGEGTACNIDSPPGHPNRFSIIDKDGKPVTTVIIRTSPRSAEGIACGIAEVRPVGEGQTIIKK